MKKEKIAIITGASKGIGKVISLSLAEKGYRCLLIARSEKLLSDLAKEIKIAYPDSPDAEVYVCDVSETKMVNGILGQIVEKYNTIDILINNAGVFKRGSIEHEVEDFKAMLDINLAAPFLFMKAIIPVMEKQGYGYIFNIASRAAKFGFPTSGFYSSSKFALLGLSESLYRKLSESNIKVTAICPSFVNTDMAFEAGAEIKGEEMIQPEDIATTIHYLLSLSKDAYIKEIVVECRKSII